MAGTAGTCEDSKNLANREFTIMGKVKTVVMGDLEAEEKSRRSGKAKREQKKAAKKEKTVEPEVAPTAAPEEPVEEKKVVHKAKKTETNKYHFPAGKKYLAAKTLVDVKKSYPVSEALDLVKKTSFSKFDGSVEAHFNVTQNNLRGTVALPHGTGRQVKVAIATDALVANLEKTGKIDFDILVASPDMMPKLAKVAKILGPKGLMPNPKTGTIGPDPEGLALSLSKGQIQWKTQPDFPIIHTVIGKVSFDTAKLEANFAALTKSVGRDKITSAFVKATMGPSIRLQV